MGRVEARLAASISFSRPKVRASKKEMVAEMVVKLAAKMVPKTMVTAMPAVARKALRESHFPPSLLHRGIKARLQDGRASVEADRRHILNCIRGADDLNAAVEGQFEACAFSEDDKYVLAHTGAPDHVIVVWKWADERPVGMMRAKGAMQEPTARRVIAQLLSALSGLHAKGVVHRDIKPENLMRNQDGVTKIADLGLAVQVEQETVDSSGGKIFGTPHFIAPAWVDVGGMFLLLGPALWHAAVAGRAGAGAAVVHDAHGAARHLEIEDVYAAVVLLDAEHLAEGLAHRDGKHGAVERAVRDRSNVTAGLA